MINEVADSQPLHLVRKGLGEDISRHPSAFLIDQRKIFPLEYLVQPRDRYSMGSVEVPHGRVLPGLEDPDHRLIVLKETNTRSIR